MLHRPTAQGIVLLTQPAHAWVSGQMARAWADGFEPREDVLLAAEQHDVGWTDWERQPTFNPKTGLPRTFLELETAEHLAIWSNAGRRVESMSTLAALLVSRHGTGLYERFHTLAQVQSEPEVLAHLESEKRAQSRWLELLRAGRGWSAEVSDEAIERASRLIAAWDWLSLIVCMNESERGEVKSAPLAGGSVDLEVTRQDETAWCVEPWPFVGDALQVAAEGRLVEGRAADARQMQNMLASARLVRVEITLMRA